MLSRIVAWTLDRPRLMVAAAVLLLIYGGIVLGRAKLDVFPDFVPAQVEVQTNAPGLTAEQVEKLVTRPVEQAISGSAGVASIRSESTAALSTITVNFAEGSQPFRDRQIVSEALNELDPLPQGVTPPHVSPLTSSTMDLLKLGFTSDKLTPMQLRDLVDWTVRPQILATDGVARATVFGGQVRRIEVRVRPGELAARGLGLSDVLAAVTAATGVSGAGYIDTPQQRVLIESHGQVQSAADVAAAPLPSVDGAAPARIGDIADVVDGAGPLDGDALIMGKPGVMMAISSQYGANTLEATHSVEKALADMAPALKAQGVSVNAGLHRPANFIGTALKGIGEDLAIGAVLIALVLFVFMRDLRTVMIAFVSIPLALLTAVIVLDRMGSTLNTMTLGGLAVALGVVVDDAVIGTENIVRRIRTATPGARARDVVLAASVEVRAPVVYATLMLIMVLLPVLLLHGLQGAFFSPLAASFIIATLASLAVAVVLTPPLALLMLRRAHLKIEPGWLRHAKHGHERILKRAIAAPGWSLIAAAVALAITVGGFMLFDSELLPSFREGHFVLGVSGPPGTSLAVMRDYGAKISRDVLAIKGVSSIEQQIGRAQGGEDPFGTERTEFHVELKPDLSGGDQDRIEKSIHGVLDSYPGLKTEVLTFLGDRIGESLSGETAALVVGIYGADLDTLDKVADQISDVTKTVKGAVDVQVQTPPKTPVVRVDLDFPAMARFGVAPADALAAIGAAYQGSAGAKIFQETRTIDVAVTTPPDMKRNPEAVGELLVRSATGTTVPLNSIAKVYLTDGRTMVAHDGGRPRQAVTANPAPRDVARVSKEVQAAVAAKVKLPPGVFLEYSGAAQGAAEARKELLFNTVLAVGGVIALLLLAFRSGRATVLILGSTPFALVGGVIAVGLTGGSLSLGSLVGFVTLFGVAARNAILLVARLQQLTEDEGHDWTVETVLLGTRERLTPILMTALVTGLGVLPLALATGQAGREIQGPMAIVILGGLITSTVASLVLLPALAWRFGRGAVTAA
ncbi:efflux RND transporter permease subunit [Phenylobacterium sp.]|jgi:CzcA family heavy metal efflux pump|uniref:efflux RND transporter permease subunit n=1 Tax=Phenylobacterium sp. TaxID=1871053 RepID=UPI002E30C433|nr:efflux RND transporter permease subunit [Phenylobacterium sp.]HEX3365317.1 efflux RND transporter permease subunit [Phenylobacterium sp.]